MTDLKCCRIEVHGYKCRFWYLPDDKFVGQRVALGKYEPYLTKLMLEQIHEGDVVVDVGANIGYDTVLFAKKAGPEGRVYALEPDKVNFAILQKNIETNKLKNVVPLRLAAGEKESILNLFKSADNYGDHRVFSTDKKQTGSKVLVKSLDQIMTSFQEVARIGFIKIDTQGFEPAVIEGAKKIIKKDKPVIFFEYWPWAYKQAGLKKERMMSFLRQNYGQINYIDEYIQIYLSKNQGWLNKHFPAVDESNYCNLWVKDRMKFGFYLGQIKDFWPKKLIKRVLKRPLT